MAIVCNRCFTQLKSTLAVGTECQKYLCQGVSIPLDDDFVSLIQQLNKKGYETIFCCAGHIDNLNVYVLMNFTFGIEMFHPDDYSKLERSLISQNAWPRSKDCLWGDLDEDSQNLLLKHLNLEWLESLPETAPALTYNIDVHEGRLRLSLRSKTGAFREGDPDSDQKKLASEQLRLLGEARAAFYELVERIPSLSKSP